MLNSLRYAPADAAAVLIVDDDPSFRAVLTRSLEQQSDCEVVGEASTLSGAVVAARQANPDIVVLDATLPDAPAAEVVEQIRSQCPGAGLLLVFDSPFGSSATEPLPDVLTGVVEKSAPVSQVVTAVRRLLDERSRRRGGAPPGTTA